MANRVNVNVNEIDESLIVSMVRKDQIRQEIVPPPLAPLPATVSVSETVTPQPEDVQEEETNASQPETTKDEVKRKRRQPDYETMFIKESNITARLGKTVYIRKEFHDRILKIVHVIGDNEISLFSYIDNIIAHHFETFQEDIIRSYNRKNSNNIF
jgi:hypothetical protein